ncbi:hypothetical protein HMN09_00394600 [Mycena chlorophos]|uniref:Uncharacterized protein n=1 Tax=Mycena chlorophos TaxID=658473 RepID=A0A8H6TFK4_MYCCL|nr:hypothetical protein HMN09_00394600 [Mycena chlorophos]
MVSSPSSTSLIPFFKFNGSQTRARRLFVAGLSAVLAGLLAVMIFEIVEHTRHRSRSTSNVFALDPGFNISAVAALAQTLPARSWEFGTATQALLELYNPEYSVFGSQPFPVPSLHPSAIPALAYAQAHITIGTGSNSLANGSGAVGDPASLGVGAVMLSKTNSTFVAACQDEIDFLVSGAPRYINGAISQRVNSAELWADFIYMAPPYLAYFGAATNNASLMETAYTQCGLYREVLLLGSNSSTPSALNSSTTDGRWRHIIGPPSPDIGLWSTGNGWAAAGMARVLATIMKAPAAQNATWKADAVANLTGWIKEIVDGARSSPVDGNLLRNYLDNTTADGMGFGEISGSSLLASVAYRMVVLAPDAFSPVSTYVAWADSIRAELGKDGHVTSNGTVTPAVNPLGWWESTPWTSGSPEGQNFVVLMYAAWRDCVSAGVCET